MKKTISLFLLVKLNGNIINRTMKYFLDTEFHEYKKKPLIGKAIDTIELISIGIISEDVVNSYTLHYTGKKPNINEGVDNTWDRKTSTNFEELQNEAIRKNSKQDGWKVKENKKSGEYYAICKEFDLKAAWNNEWLRENVLKSIWIELEIKHLQDYNSVLYIMNQDADWKTLIKEEFFKFDRLKNLLKEYGKTKKQIAEDIYDFCITYDSTKSVKENNPEFYAYYADYDWVVFCWLFGRMIDLPKGFPMYCKDLKQILDESAVNYSNTRKLEPSLKLLKEHTKYPRQENEHNALADAKWNYELYKFLNRLND